MRGIEFGVRKQRLDSVLAVIERAFNGKVVNIGIQNGSHLCLLDGRHSTVREQDEDRDILLPPKSVDGCRPGISAGGTNDGQMVSVFAFLTLVLPHQEVFKQVSEELKRNILERKRRAVEKFEQVEVLLSVQFD